MDTSLNLELEKLLGSTPMMERSLGPGGGAEQTLQDISQRIVRMHRTLDNTLLTIHEEVSSLKQDLQVFESSISLREREVERKIDALSFIKARIEGTTIAQMSAVKLNIGGSYFETSVQTLTSVPDTMLCAMFSGQFKLEKDPEGRYFIDRDGTHFDIILNFLRDGYTDYITDESIRLKVIREARYYCLGSLVGMLEGTIPQFPHFTWDDVSPPITLSKGTQVSTTSSTWQHARSSFRMVTGVFYWEIKLVSYDAKNSLNIAIGITKEPLKVSCIMGYSYNPDSWAYIVGTGCSAHNKSYSIPYANPSQEGDIVGVKVDLRQHTLEFFRNGTSLGVAFNNVTGPVYPAVSLVNHQTVCVQHPPQMLGWISADPLTQAPQTTPVLNVSPDTKNPGL